MQITIWGINYAPEVTGIAPYTTKLSEFLAQAGHHVRVVTTFPYYPEWKKRPADRKKWFASSVANGVKVDRCWHYVPRRVSSLRRILHEASFVAGSFLRLLILPAPDVYVVISPPLLLGLACGILSRLKRSRFVFHVQDLQPGAAIELGMLKGSLLLKSLFWLEASAYRHAGLVSGISQGMRQVFLEKGVEEDRAVLFPNWISPLTFVAPAPGAFRRANNIRAEDLLLVYSGNLGYKQGLEILIEAAALLKSAEETGITLVICGAGARRDALAEQAAGMRLGNLRMLDLLPEQSYEEMMRDADACVITQITGTGRSFFPSKLLAALQRGKPVVAVSDATSELAVAIAEGGFGMNILPDNPRALAGAFLQLRDGVGGLERMGRQASIYAQRFACERVLGEFADRLSRFAGVHTRLGSDRNAEPCASLATEVIGSKGSDGV